MSTFTLVDMKSVLKKKAAAAPAPVDPYGAPTGAAPPVQEPGLAPPPGAAPPVDPAMMAAAMGGGAPPGGMPMDPAMMMGGAPGGMPMDPAMMAGAPPLMPPGEAPGGGALPGGGGPEELEQQLAAVVQEAIKPLEDRIAQLEATLEGEDSFPDSLFEAKEGNEEVVKQASAEMIADLLAPEEKEDKPAPRGPVSVMANVLKRFARK